MKAPPSQTHELDKKRPLPTSQDVTLAHQTYCDLTGQKVRLLPHREQLWFELLRSGFTVADVKTLVTYLKREIREGRRNHGAIKLSNLLQPDRFEEDLELSRIKLKPLEKAAPLKEHRPENKDKSEQERRRLFALECIRKFRADFGGREN